MLIRWQKTIVDQRGNVQPGAVLTVRRESDQSLTRIYRDREGLRPYPTGTVTADEYGYAYFYAAPDLYRISSAQPAIDWRDENVGFQDLQQASVTYLTKADMLADTSQPVPTLASVVKDSVEENNAFYVWDGSDWALSSLNPATLPDIQAIAVEAVAEATAEAEGYRDQSEVSAQSASQFADQARAAAEASGERELFDTYAEADAAVASIPEGKAVEVLTDEQNAGAHTLYRVESGALVFKLNLDYLEEQLADGVTPGRGASMVYFSQPGGPARSAANKFRDTISVRDYITTAIDGVTSNQEGIVAAVSHCFTNGLTLFWPGGSDYVSTDTIPNFHNVQHIGTGRLRRGSDVFYISPDKTQTNTVYAAPTGGASGFDGLTADRPVASVEQAIEILKSHPTGVLCGNWDIQLLPGRFTQGVRIQDFPTSRAKVRIMGRVDDDGNPLTIFDGASSSRFEAINIVLGAAKVSYHNLRFENWRHSTGGGVGIQHRYGGEVDIVDCEFYDCDSGVFVFEQRLRCFGGLFEDCDYGLRASYQSNFTTYVSDSETSKYPRPFFKNCVESAVIASRGTIGHLDYIDSQDGKRMLTLGESSRVHVMGCSAKRHTLTAVLCRGSSQWLDDPAVPNNFHMGTADACACIAQHEGGSRETRVHGQDRGEQAYRQMTFTDLITHTGTTGLTPLSSGGNSFIARVPPYYFADVRKKISVQLNGTLTGSAGSKTFGLYSSGVEIHTLTVPAGLSGGYVVEWDIHAQAASQQRVLAKLLIDGQPAVIKSATTNVSLSTVELLLNVRVQLSDAADTIIVRRVESFITG